jgi:hypothetical protein
MSCDHAFLTFYEDCEHCHCTKCDICQSINDCTHKDKTTEQLAEQGKKNKYLIEAERAKKSNASKEYIDRMIFLSKINNVDNKIDEWINDAIDTRIWWDNNKQKRIILSKAIQQGIQIALDSKQNSMRENKQLRAEIAFKHLFEVIFA